MPVLGDSLLRKAMPVITSLMQRGVKLILTRLEVIATPLGPSTNQLESPRLDRKWYILSHFSGNHLRKDLLFPEVLLQVTSFYFYLQDRPHDARTAAYITMPFTDYI